ncbi:MAG: carboxylating nicotinate-nucleotide diphosphorylase [Desulfohalobiaceae bacterium]|nr:carboxylating nicotinate-nucleotide diphosphorylase [Desulfohalobiaceae bacterium]
MEDRGRDLFHAFFAGEARDFLLRGVDMALEEDGPDLTSNGIFAETDTLSADLIAKESTLVAGLPLAEVILERLGAADRVQVKQDVPEGSPVGAGDCVCRLQGSARSILRAERVFINYVAHLSGIADFTASFVQRLRGTGTLLLDTRKTLPCLRYPEKYAVRLGGGKNHRMNLTQMLMLKDNHLDRCGGINRAVNLLRQAYSPCPPIVVECRTLREVEQAVSAGVERILLDNMGPEDLSRALCRIPAGIETEISGGVDRENIGELAGLGADYISAGRLTNAARSKDFSLKSELTCAPSGG